MVINNDDPIRIKNELLKLEGDVVILDAEKIICEEQIYAAIKRANHARENDKMLAKIWGIEVLIQISARHQISEALKILDISKNTKIIIIISNIKLSDARFVSGFPQINPSVDVINQYKLNDHNKCKEIIAKGVLLMLNHE